MKTLAMKKCMVMSRAWTLFVIVRSRSQLLHPFVSFGSAVNSIGAKPKTISLVS